MRSTPTTEQLFDKYVLPEPLSGCWLWTGADDKLGYGTITRHTVNMKAHQAFYEHFKGPVPDGLELDHKCRTPRCVNPSHLEAVTHQVNMLRGNTIGARYAARTHCARGHEFAGENLIFVKGASARACRTCRTEQGQAWRAKNPERQRELGRLWRARQKEKTCSDIC